MRRLLGCADGTSAGRMKFIGFRGEVKEVDEQTAKVAVQVFGRVTPMDLALGQIEFVPENSN